MDASAVKRRFLVVYDYGQGGVWAFVLATSANAIVERFPELQVIDEIPRWMDDDLRRKLESETQDVDEPRDGLLADLVKMKKGRRER
jgi:hypothetical protein